LVAADLLNEKRNEHHDEIKRKGHSELREGDKKDVPVIS
jgi:hypothetical protein